MKGTIVKLGAFIVVCLGFTAWLAFTIGNVRVGDLGPFDDSYSLSATFDDVTGLLVDDNVKVAGVKVGKVTDIEIVEGRAKVTFAVDDDVQVAADTQAAVRWRNLLGQRYVYLYPGQASTVLRDGDAVGKTRSVVDLGELFNRLGPIVQAVEPEQVNIFLDAVVGALDGNQAKLSRAIDDLARLSGGLAQRDQAISRLIGNLDTVAGTITTRDQQIKTVLDNLLAVVDTFSDNTAVLDQAVTSLSDFSDNLAFLLTRNRTQIDNIVTGLRTLSAEVGEKLPTLDSALANLDEGAARLFAAGRYGEWLNQAIPCGRFFYGEEFGPDKGVNAQETCNATPEATNSPASTRGPDAVRQLLGMGAGR